MAKIQFSLITLANPPPPTTFDNISFLPNSHTPLKWTSYVYHLLPVKFAISEKVGYYL